MTQHIVVERSTVIAAASKDVIRLIVDFHEWPRWSPWEGMDPDQRTTHSGPERGVGAVSQWSGNRKVGAGRMEIKDVSETSVDIDVDFTRPFKSSSRTRFDLSEVDGGTRVGWRMTTPKTLGMRIFGFFMDMDKAIGKDIEKGLAGMGRTLGDSS